jgi:hypothetical protein
MNQNNVSPTTMGQIPPKGLVMAKRWVVPRKFGVECGPMQYENKVGTTKEIHSLNFQGENNPKGVQKYISKRPLANKCGMCWNANLKESKKNLMSWSSL